MSDITFAELIKSQHLNAEDVLMNLAESKEDDAYVFLAKDINSFIKRSAYLKLPKGLLYELAVKLRTKEIKDNLNVIAFFLHATGTKKGEKVFLSIEELELPDWEVDNFLQYQTYCIFPLDLSFRYRINLCDEDHPLHNIYSYISNRHPDDKVRRDLTISKIELSIDKILIQSDCRLMPPRRMMTNDEILYSTYPCLDQKHEDYNEKLAWALKGHKAIVTDKKYGAYTSFVKTFQKFIEDEKANHSLDPVRDNNMIRNMAYVASSNPVKSETDT